MLPAPEFLISRNGPCPPLGVAYPPRLPPGKALLDRLPAINAMKRTGRVFCQRQFCAPYDSGRPKAELLGRHPAGNGVLEGGRNLLLESAQEATLTSVTISALPRQSNDLATADQNTEFNRIFTLAEFFKSACKPCGSERCARAQAVKCSRKGPCPYTDPDGKSSWTISGPPGAMPM